MTPLIAHWKLVISLLLRIRPQNQDAEPPATGRKTAHMWYSLQCCRAKGSATGALESFWVHQEDLRLYGLGLAEKGPERLVLQYGALCVGLVVLPWVSASLKEGAAACHPLPELCC